MQDELSWEGSLVSTIIDCLGVHNLILSDDHPVQIAGANTRTKVDWHPNSKNQGRILGKSPASIDRYGEFIGDWTVLGLLFFTT